MQRMMRLELPEPRLRDLLIRQLSSLYFISDEEVEVLEDVLPEALRRCEVCFSHVRNKYYSGECGHTRLDPLHGCHHAYLLYMLSRCIHLRGGGVGFRSVR